MEAAAQDEAQRESLKLDVLLRLALAHLEAGRAATGAVGIVRECAAALGLPDVVVVNAGRVMLLSHTPASGRSSTRVGTAASIENLNCEAMKNLHRVSVRLMTGQLRAEDAAAEIDRAAAVARPWWWAPGGLAVLSFSVALQVSGRPLVALLTALVQLATSMVAGRTAGMRAPRLFTVALQSAAAAVFAAVAPAMGLVPWTAGIVTVAVVWMLLVPLPQVVNAVLDGVNGQGLAVAARVSIIVATVGGIAIGGHLALRTGAQLELSSAGELALPTLAIPLAIAFSVLGAMGNAFANRGGPGLLLPAAGIGLLTAVCSQTATHVLRLPSPWSSTLSAVVLGLAAALLAGRIAYPAATLVLLGLTGVLLPGLTVYQGVASELFHASGGPYFVQAAAVCVGLGVGTALGFYLASLIPLGDPHSKPYPAIE